MIGISPEYKEHILTNIALWFSSKHNVRYFIISSNSGDNHKVIHFVNYDYNKARQELEKYINNLGKLIEATYIHSNDCYYLATENDELIDEYVIFAVYDEDIIEV